MKLLALVTGLVLAGGAGFLLLNRSGEPAPAPQPTVQVGRSDVTFSVAASGKVQPVATRELAFSRAGTLASVAVKAGDTVTVGQTLATIDPADAKAAVETAEDALADAKQQLADAQSPSRAPSKGDPVYTAQVAVNKAQLAYDKAKRTLSGTQIIAPVSGKILKVNGKAGDGVTTATFITLGVVEKLMVEAQFAEADSVSLAVGQKASVTLSSHPGQTFQATIAQVAAQGTVANRLVRYTVLLALDAPPADLLIGQSATATVVLRRVEKALRLPQSAVRLTRAETGAETGADTGEVKLAGGGVRQVGVGLRGDGFVEITSGLTEGETVLSVFRG